MLITRSPFSEEQTHLPEATSPSDALLKRLDVLLDDDLLFTKAQSGPGTATSTNTGLRSSFFIGTFNGPSPI